MERFSDGSGISATSECGSTAMLESTVGIGGGGGFWWFCTKLVFGAGGGCVMKAAGGTVWRGGNLDGAWTNGGRFDMGIGD